MRVHHLNCGTMTPLIVGRIVCHVLLCESGDGLVLVDTGFGLSDCADPARIGPARFLLNARFDPAETAVRQVEARGFDRSDVRHIVITHFDVDHVGGLSDFPDATVHTTAIEFGAANRPPTRAERRRYRSVQWNHGPKVETYAGPGDSWQGFEPAYPVTGVDGMAIVPMAGHSRGHALVAVDADERGWLLHAGDAAFDRGSIAVPSDPAADRVNRRTIKVFERAVGQDRAKIVGNHARLAEVRAAGTATVIPAHDPVIFDRAAVAPPG
jgi:glyoxylase-like metal-dependent hydrolase (beta-lactamase superfamily II)